MRAEYLEAMAICCLAGLLALIGVVYAGGSGDAKTGTEPRTYLPNSKSNPLAPTFADVPYGEHERNKLDLWQAESEAPTPVVMILHGGGWTAGSKTNVPRRSSFPNIRALLGNGISVVAINYRLIGKHTEGVTPPVKATLQDAARAVQFIRSKAREWNIDKERIGAAGVSAGGCSCLWLAYHDDLADPKSKDPVARESSRLWCAAGSGAQTTLDPKQMKEWFPNAGYGGHAFGKGDFAEFLADRERLLPWIAKYSPCALVSADDPPVCLFYGSKPPAPGVPSDALHGANFGVGLQKRCAEVGVECHVVYPGAANVKYRTPLEYLTATLKAPAGPIPEAEITALERELALSRTRASAVGIRRACKSVARKASALLEASPKAPNRFRVLGVLFQCRKRLLGLEMTEKNRKALFETCTKLSKAPDEYVALRLDADLLLSERDLAEAEANVTERVSALKKIIEKYRDTPAERRSLVIAAMIASRLQVLDLAADIGKELAGSSIGGDREVIAFRRRSLDVMRLDAVFSGTYESANNAFLTFPSDRLGHQYLVVFWSRASEECDAFLRRIRKQQERFPGRFEVYSFNLDRMPDAGKSILNKLGVKCTALRLPGGRRSLAYQAYARMEPVAIFVNAQGHVSLKEGRKVPWPTPSPARGKEAANPGPGLGMWLDDGRYVAQFRSLFIGDFLVAEAGALPTKSGLQASAAAPLHGASISEETLRAIQSCFTPPPLRYRLTREAEAAGYRKAEKLCAAALKQHPAAPGRWAVRNRRIIALMGMWNLARESKHLEEAVKEAKAALAMELPPGADVVARFCLAKDAWRGGRADPEALLRDFLDARGGGKVPATALAAAAVLAIEANAEALYQEYRQRLLSLSDEDHPGLWPVLSFIRDRHHGYRLFWGNPGRWGYTRRQRYKVRCVISGVGAPEETSRVLVARLKGLDGQELRIPQDAGGKMTGIVFIEPPEDESDRSMCVRRVKDFAGQFSKQDVPVIGAFLSEDMDTVKSLIKDSGGAFRAVMAPGGLRNPLVRRLGILSADRMPNPFLLHGDGTIAWWISGLTYPVEHTSMEGAVSASIGINIEKLKTDRAFEALEQGEFKRALLLLGERLPPKLAADSWTADRLQGCALAHMGLNNWEAALTAIDAALSERKRASRHGRQISLGTVEMHFVKSTVLKKLSRDQEAEDERAIAQRGLAWLERIPDAGYPPSYARNGIPVGVYDELLKNVRSALEGREQ